MAVERRFTLVAEHPALDFANTLDKRYDPQNRQELLASYGDLLDFCRTVGLTKKADAKSLRRIDDEQKSRALSAARDLREAIEEVFAATTRGEAAPAEALALLNRHVQTALSHRTLIQRQDRSFRWKWTAANRHPLAPLWPLALAAVELLKSDRLEFVKQCGAETCGWLFLDLSKNHSRRWCEMRTCGNRTKVRRHYEKNQQETGGKERHPR